MRRLSVDAAHERVAARKLARALNWLADYAGVPRFTADKVLAEWRRAARLYATGYRRRLRPRT